MYPHPQTDTVQINAPEYDPDIDGDNPPQTPNNRAIVLVQEILNTLAEPTVEGYDNNTAPVNDTNPEIHQETDWPDASPIQIPGISSMTPDQLPEVTYNRCQTHSLPDTSEIPNLEEDSNQD